MRRSTRRREHQPKQATKPTWMVSKKSAAPYQTQSQAGTARATASAAAAGMTGHDLGCGMAASPI
jgi:hypothetical protein